MGSFPHYLAPVSASSDNIFFKDALVGSGCGSLKGLAESLPWLLLFEVVTFFKKRQKTPEHALCFQGLSLSFAHSFTKM